MTAPQPLSPILLQAIAGAIDRYRADDADLLALLIREVGIASFEASIPQLVPLLSHRGVTPHKLQALASYARRVDSTQYQTVRRQHVVSEVVLKQFCKPPTKRGKLQPFDLAKGERTHDLRTPHGAAWVYDFVTKDSQAAEAVWGQVENDLESALAALEQSPDLHDPEHVRVIKAAIALHFARSQFIRDTIHAMARERLAPLLAAARNPAVPTPTAARLHAFAAMVEDGTYFRYRVVRVFRLLRDAAAARQVTILVPPPGQEFLIGDSPAVACDVTNAQIRPREAVGFANPAVLVAMPLRPDRLAILGPTDGWGQCTAADVGRFNTYQVQQAKRYVYHHPGANFDAFFESVRPASQPVRDPAGTR